MTILQRIAVIALVFLVHPARADDLLYASNGKQLFTLDLQTGAPTFVSDGPLRWIASPTFDEQHHTRLWVDANHFRETGGVQFYWGNPFTGEYGGPYPATVSYAPVDPSIIGIFSEVVYAPTTQRLYTMAYLYGSGTKQNYVPVMIDQYNGPAIPQWGTVLVPFWDEESENALAFDSTSGLILQAYNGSSGLAGNGYGVRTLDPVTGQWGDYFSVVFSFPAPQQFHEIWSMAVQPTTGDLYFLLIQTDPVTDVRTVTLMRRDAATGQVSAITEYTHVLLGAILFSMVFADASYAGP